jgi:hypothetical protein
MYPMHVWQIDWTTVTKWEDLKELLQGCDIQVNDKHPQFDEIRKFCKLVDRDGKRVDPASFGPKRGDCGGDLR